MSPLRFNFVFCIQNIQYAENIIRYVIMYYDIYVYICIYIYVYIYNDMYNVLYDLRNTAYWIVINKSLSEATRSNFRNTLIQWTLYIFYWINMFLKLLLVASLSDLFITMQYAVFRIYIYIPLIYS